MKKLIRYLKNYKKESVLGPLFKLLEVVFELMVPMIMASLIDKGIGNRDEVYIGKMFGMLILLGLLGLASSVTAQYFAAKAATGFAKEVKKSLFSHIQQLSLKDLDKIGSATLITRMTSDMNQVQTGVNMTLRLLLRSPFVVFGAMVMAFFIDVKAAMVFVVAIPVLSVVIFGIMLLCIPKYRIVQEKLDGVLLATRENLSGVRVLRAFCKEEEEIRRFHEKNEDLTGWQKKVGMLSGMMNPLTYIMINIAIAVLIWQGAIEVSTGVLTQGAVIALYNYMSQILVELIKLANLIVSMTKSIASGNRIQAVFDIQPTMKEKEMVSEDARKTEYLVELQNVMLKYTENADPALENVNVKIKRGETIGVIGGTGSGKSSFVNLIPRFYDVSEGAVFFDGKNVKSYSYEELRKRVSVCQQKAVLFQGTIEENMRWGREDATEEEIWRAVELAQAKEFVEQKKEGLQFSITQGGKNLSGGQKQRLTIARALLQEYDLLILDDSSSALDYATDAKLRKALAEKKQEQSVIVVSQRTASIQHADRILVFDDGKIVGQGTHDSLLKECQVYQEIYNSQFKKEA